MEFEKLFMAASAIPAGAIDKDELEMIANIPRPFVKQERRESVIDTIRFEYQLPEEYDAILLKPDVKTAVKTARQVYNGGAGRWLVGVIESSVLVIVARGPLVAELDNWLAVNGLHNAGKFQRIAQEASLMVVRCSLVFELNRSYRWISIGPDMFTMSVNDIITTPNLAGHKNVAVITIQDNEVYMQVRRYFPLDIQRMNGSNDSTFNVVVLPGLSEGLCTFDPYHRREPPAYLKSPQALADYWQENHGYEIPVEVIQQTVDVSLANSGLELTYPAVCVWRHKWSYLPHHTREYLPVMRERLEKEVKAIVELWSTAAPRRMLPLGGISMTNTPDKHRKRQRTARH